MVFLLAIMGTFLYIYDIIPKIHFSSKVANLQNVKKLM